MCDECRTSFLYINTEGINTEGEGGTSPPKAAEPPPPPQNKKTKHGKEFQKVTLHPNEFATLNKEYGADVVEDYINRLDVHLASEGKKYNSHYATIRKWIAQDKRKVKEGKSKQNRFVNFNQRDNDYAQYELLEREHRIKRMNEMDGGADGRDPTGKAGGSK